MRAETLKIIPLRGVKEGVEQGVSIYYKLGRYGFIFDCGIHPEEKITEEELIAVYKRLKDSGFPLDCIFLTHSHTDHIRGALWVAGHFHIPIYCTSVCKRTLKNIAERDEVNFDAIKFVTIQEGDELKFGRATIRVREWAHSTADALGFEIHIGGRHLLHMGDGKLTGIHSESFNDNIAMFEEIAKEPLHLLTFDALKADRGGVTPAEMPMIENIAKIAAENTGKKIFIFMFATHLDKIQAIIKQVLDRVYSDDEKYRELREGGVSIRFGGTAMKNAAQIIEEENEIPNLVKNLYRRDAETSVVFGTTGGEFSYDRRLVQKNGFLKDKINPGDVVIFSCGLIPCSDKTEFERKKREAKDMVEEMLRLEARIYTTKWFAKDLQIQDRVTTGHFNLGGHEGQKGLQKVLDILRPQMILPFHLLKGGCTALQRLAGEGSIVLQPEHFECVNLGAIENPKPENG